MDGASLLLLAFACVHVGSFCPGKSGHGNFVIKRVFFIEDFNALLEKNRTVGRAVSPYNDYFVNKRHS